MVDHSGAKSAEIMHRLGMEGWISEEQVLENQLATFGLTLAATFGGFCTPTSTSITRDKTIVSRARRRWSSIVASSSIRYPD